MGLGKDLPTSVIRETNGLGDGPKNPRRIELSERARALDHRSLGLAHPCEVKLYLGNSAGGPAISRTRGSSCFAYPAVEGMLRLGRGGRGLRFPMLLA